MAVLKTSWATKKRPLKKETPKVPEAIAEKAPVITEETTAEEIIASLPKRRIVKKAQKEE